MRLGGLCQSGAGRRGCVTGPGGTWDKGALSGGKVPPLPALGVFSLEFRRPSAAVPRVWLCCVEAVVL